MAEMHTPDGDPSALRTPQSARTSPRRGRLMSCGCGRPHGLTRRQLAAGLGGLALSSPAWQAAWAQSGAAAALPECKRSGFTQVVASEPLEQAAAEQYAQLLGEARSKRALAPAGHPQLERLRTIARRLVPFTTACNAAAARWRWEVNLIGSDQVNAFCMPGGKIAFFSGILDRLSLSDDEAAMVMGHEMAHALLEHASEQAGKTMATRGLFELGAALFGLGDVGRVVGGVGGQLLSLRFSRSDESEADALGLLLGAEAGYDPRAAITLWQKMDAQSRGAPPQWLSSHPSHGSRIRELQARMPRAQALYAAARRARDAGGEG